MSTDPAATVKKQTRAKTKSSSAKTSSNKKAVSKATKTTARKKSAKSTKTKTTKKTAAKTARKSAGTHTAKAKTSRTGTKKTADKKSRIMETRVEQMMPSASEEEIQAQQNRQDIETAPQAETAPVMLPETSIDNAPAAETKTESKSEIKPDIAKLPQKKNTQPARSAKTQETVKKKQQPKSRATAEAKSPPKSSDSGVLAPIKKVLRMIRPSDQDEKRSIIAQLSDQERQKLIKAARNNEKANFIDDIDSAVLSDPEPIEPENEANEKQTITPPQPPSNDLEKNLSGLDVPPPVAANKKTGEDIKKRIRPFVAPSAYTEITKTHQTREAQPTQKQSFTNGPTTAQKTVIEHKADKAIQSENRQVRTVEPVEPKMAKIPEVQREAMRAMEADETQYEPQHETETAVMTAPEEIRESVAENKINAEEERLNRVNRLLHDTLQEHIDREKDIAPIPEESLAIEYDQNSSVSRIEKREEQEKAHDKAQIPDELSQLLHKLRSAHEDHGPEEILEEEKEDPAESQNKSFNKITLVRAAENTEQETGQPDEDLAEHEVEEEINESVEEMETVVEDEPEKEEPGPGRQWSLDVEIALRELCGDVTLTDNQSFDEMVAIWRESYINYFSESLGDTRYPYIWIDAHTIGKKARSKSHTFLTMTGVSLSGEKRILELNEADPRDPESWRNMLRSLERRDLANPRLFIGNSDLPIWEFLPSIFPRAASQFCWDSFLHDILKQFPEQNRGEVKKRIEKIRFAETRESAEEWIEYFKARFGGTYPRAVSDLLKSKDSLLTCFGFPTKHWNEIKTAGHIDVSYPSDALMDTAFKYEQMHGAALFLVFNYLRDSQRKWSRMKHSAKLRAVQNGRLYHNGRRISEKKAEKIKHKTDKNNQSLFDRILIALGMKKASQKPEEADQKLPIKPRVDRKRSAPPQENQAASAGNAGTKDRKSGLEQLLVQKWSGTAKSGGRMNRNISMKKSSAQPRKDANIADHPLSGMERELLEELKSEKASAGE